MSNEIHRESIEDTNNDKFNEVGDSEPLSEPDKDENDEVDKSDETEAETDETEAETDEVDKSDETEDETDEVDETDEAEAETDEVDETDEAENNIAEPEYETVEPLTLTIKSRLNDEELSKVLDKAVSEFNNRKTIINLFLFEFLFRNFELDSANEKHIKFLKNNNIITEKSGGTRKNRHSLRNTRRHI